MIDPRPMEQPDEIALTECRECAEMYDATESDHCPCQKRCSLCGELRHIEEEFWKNDANEEVCADCIIALFDEHHSDDRIAVMAQSFVAALRKYGTIDVDPVILLELARCMVKVK